MTTSKARSDFRMRLLALAILAAAAWLVYWLLGKLFPSELHATAGWLVARLHALIRWVSGWIA
ncbi:hypothetical protein [Thermomonas fusca]|uniref:Uncharacterized protein n=1 Tax=Thermomonas fusca TaxID=215690 RepID=A0A5R9PE53_9GAMM|nr:hypothetical protein [Thermomonas fusca]TLX21652.1 hypothetical protein E5S66_09010 [Thermomonas fusca]